MTSLNEPYLYREQTLIQQTSTLLFAVVNSYEGAVGRLLVAFIENHGIAVHGLPDHVCMSVPDHNSLIAVPLDELVRECMLVEHQQALTFNTKIFLSMLRGLTEWQDVRDIADSCIAFNRFTHLAKASDPPMLLNAEVRKAIHAVGKRCCSELQKVSYQDDAIAPHSVYEVHQTEHRILSYAH